MPARLRTHPGRWALTALLLVLVGASCTSGSGDGGAVESGRLASAVESRGADGEDRASRADTRPPVAPADAPPGDGEIPHLERPPAPEDLPPLEDFESVAVQRPAVRLDGVTMDEPLPAVLGHPSVLFATVVRFTKVQMTTTDGRPSVVRVAAVDPRGFRVFTPQVTADTVPLWQHAVDGGAIVDHGAVERLGLELGGPLQIDGGPPLRVGAFASIGYGPTADVVVSAATAAKQGLRGPVSVLVSLNPTALPSRVGRELAGAVGGEATPLIEDRAVELGFTHVAPHQWHEIWDRLAACESGGRWHLDSGNGYYGGLQFLPESWWYVGGQGMPHEASREEQIARAKILLALQGWEAWPACSKALGFR